MKNSKITVLFCFHDGNKNNGGNRSLIDVIDNLLEKKNIEINALELILETAFRKE